MRNAMNGQQSGQAFLVSYINTALPECQPARAEAYGAVQALQGHTLPAETRSV